MKHGHVTPNPDGSKARCGGPAICIECAMEMTEKIANGEIDKLNDDLQVINAMSEEFIRKIILDWKHAWMNQTQNSKEDYDNYHRRAWGIDANMQWDLARKLAKSFARIVSEHRMMADKLASNLCGYCERKMDDAEKDLKPS